MVLNYFEYENDAAHQILGNKNALQQNEKQALGAASVTRFGEICPLWRNFKNNFMRVYLVFGQILTYFVKFCMLLGKF